MKKNKISLKDWNILLMLLILTGTFMFLAGILSVLEVYPIFPKYFKDQIVFANIIVGIYFFIFIIRNINYLVETLHAPIHIKIEEKIKSLEPPMNL